MSALEPSQPGVPAGTAGLPRLPAASSTADTAIRASTAAVVLAVAGIAAYISYWQAYTVVRQYGPVGGAGMLAVDAAARTWLRKLAWTSCAISA